MVLKQKIYHAIIVLGIAQQTTKLTISKFYVLYHSNKKDYILVEDLCNDISCNVWLQITRLNMNY